MEVPTALRGMLHPPPLIDISCLKCLSPRLGNRGKERLQARREKLGFCSLMSSVSPIRSLQSESCSILERGRCRSGEFTCTQRKAQEAEIGRNVLWQLPGRETIPGAELQQQEQLCSGGGLPLLVDIEHGRLLGEIKRIISKDRQWLEEVLWREQRSVDVKHGQLVEGIKRVILRDRQWVEEVLTGDSGYARGRLASNWNRSLLVAVPGVAGLNLSGPQSVLEALGVLAAIITVHEAGHFLAARLQNIHVTKFAVGFGPTLASVQKKGVEYSLRAFPFGGFVAFPDDDPESEFAPDDPNLLKNRPLLDRALVISAGVIANLVFAYSILFVQTLGVGLLERELRPGVVVPEVISKSAAAKAGMRAGDVVLAVDGYELSAKDSAVFELVDTIKRNPGRTMTLFVQRDADVLGVEVTPDENSDGSGRIGVQLSPNGQPHRVKAENLADAVLKSNREFGRLTATVVDGLKQILFNFEKTVDSVSGPVAIVAVGAEVARSDITGLFQFAAIVNINLAIVNLLPLPALDGGYLAFIMLEALRGGKKLPDGVEQGIMSSGVLLLLAVGIVLMVRDTLNLGLVQQML